MYVRISRLKLESTKVVKLLHEPVKESDRHSESRANVWFGFEVKFGVDYGRCLCGDNNVLLLILGGVMYR